MDGQPTAAPDEPLRLHIFRPGRHTDASGRTLEFSAEDLARCAAAYDTSLHEAPLVIGHPEDDSPAFGWVKRLSLDPEGGLWAEVEDLAPGFVEAVRSGRFRKVSASFYLPSSAANPTPGVLSLRHVGFLGALPPSVKGLAPVRFKEGDHGDAADLVSNVSVAKVEECSEHLTQSGHTTQRRPPMTDEMEGRLQALQEENARLAGELEAARAELSRRERAARHEHHAAFCETLVKEGRLPPGAAPVITAVLDALAEAPVAFGEGEKTRPLAEALAATLEGLPPIVSFGEAAPAEKGDEPAKTIREMSGREAVELFRRDPAAFRRAAGLA